MASNFDQQYYALLADRIREGDHDAFAELYDATHGMLYRSVQYFLRDPDDIRDALQEIYISVYNNIGRLKIDRLLVPWMRQIAYHTCCDFLREQKTMREMSVPLDDSDLPPRLSADDPFRQVFDQDAWESVKDQLAKLPVKVRKAFLLRYESGLKLEEVASFMGVSLASVKRYVSAAQSALQKELTHMKP